MAQEPDGTDLEADAPEGSGAGPRGERSEERSRARTVAHRYLAHKPRTEQEVRRRLDRADVSSHVTEDLMVELREQGYVDDEAYAREFASQRNQRDYGPYRVEKDLRSRGVAQETIDAAIAEVFERSELRETVRELARTRWSRYQQDEDARRRKKKVHDYLVRRGFPFDLIREALAEITD